MIGGVWAEKFDHLAAFTGFVITPMTFLSGTFYRLDSLPEPFHSLSHWNPMYYLVDGFRYGFVGQADSNLFVSVAVTLLLSIAVVLGSWSVFDRGWRLKARAMNGPCYASFWSGGEGAAEVIERGICLRLLRGPCLRVYAKDGGEGAAAPK